MAGCSNLVSGVTTRERDRLARIFVKQEDRDAIAGAILGNSWDDHVFKFAGPESILEDPPMTAKEKELEKQLKQEE